MKVVVSLLLSLLLANFTQALQMILSTRDPVCLVVKPTRVGVSVNTRYTISGVNEDQVKFVVTQGDKELASKESGKEFQVDLKAYRQDNMIFCWQKLDRKAKKVNFMITQSSQALDEKANPDSIEAVQAKMESLQIQLDQISMNIVSQ